MTYSCLPYLNPPRFLPSLGPRACLPAYLPAIWAVSIQVHCMHDIYYYLQ